MSPLAPLSHRGVRKADVLLALAYLVPLYECLGWGAIAYLGLAVVAALVAAWIIKSS